MSAIVRFAARIDVRWATTSDSGRPRGRASPSVRIDAGMSANRSSTPRGPDARGLRGDGGEVGAGADGGDRLPGVGLGDRLEARPGPGPEGREALPARRGPRQGRPRA